MLADDTLHGFVLNNGLFTTVVVPNENGRAQQTEINSTDVQGEIVGLYVDFHGVQHGFQTG